MIPGKLFQYDEPLDVITLAYLVNMQRTADFTRMALYVNGAFTLRIREVVPKQTPRPIGVSLVYNYAARDAVYHLGLAWPN